MLVYLAACMKQVHAGSDRESTALSCTKEFSARGSRKYGVLKDDGVEDPRLNTTLFATLYARASH
jgi:hypothetical protein